MKQWKIWSLRLTEKQRLVAAVERYVTPEEFAEWKRIGLDLGFKHVESSPLTRSSYHARQQTESGEANLISISR